MKQTLRDIAAVAHVSVSTASRALNGNQALNPETIARVRHVAESLRYEQRRSHRRLDARRCLAKAKIGVMTLGMNRSLLTLPAISQALSGAEQTLADAGATVQWAHVPDVSHPPASLLRDRLDGLIVAGAMQGDLNAAMPRPLVDRLRTLPTVWVLGRPEGCWGDAVTSNDYRTGAMAAEYLSARGHRNLAFVNPKPDHPLFVRRQDGFVAAAHRLGARPQCFCDSPAGGWRLPLEAPRDVELVQSLVDRLIRSRSRPSAIFAAADSVAALVYRALTVRELRVGRDISVISGNNDRALVDGLHPHLTTFDIHAHELGRLAVRQLATRISYPAEVPEAEIMLAPTLIEAESVVSLNQAAKK